ncbi:MAG: asparagine synthase (glutamine-hydrolyzing) [Deltaproteobacteria bacterium]
MCGIAGVVDWNGAEGHREALEAAARAMAPRGPDGDGFHLEGPVGLAHRRLSIIDLGGGGQPMLNEDASVAIVFNGEIYNYKELAAELAPRHRFRTSSDTEVLLRLYEDRGERMLEGVRGMFAFALWDRKAQRLFAARDRYGEKPFLYTHERGRLAFASEMGALRALAGRALDAAIDRDALEAYLGLLYVPAPRSIFRDVHKLPAGHALSFDRARGLRVLRYDTVPVPGSAPSTLRASTLASTRRILEEAVRLQLRSDVPLGALLSGGIDSSVVVALMARELARPVRTFSVGFGRDDDELPHARAVAERYRTEHTEIVLSDGLEARVERALEAYSEPFADSSAVPTVAVFDAVAPHVKVVLTGDGGDELFAGYDRYREVLRLPRVPGAAHLAAGLDRWMRFGRTGRMLGRARRAALLAAIDPTSRARALVEVFGPGERTRLVGGPVREIAGVPELDPLALSAPDRAMAEDLHRYLPDDLMLKTDTAAMAASVESRSPFLDPELARYVVPLAWFEKQSRREGKTLLKELAADLLPASILSRKKRGFGSPVEAWLAGPLRARFHDTLRARDAFVRSTLDPRAVDDVVSAVSEGRGNAHQGWALFALETWSRKHLRGG